MSQDQPPNCSSLSSMPSKIDTLKFLIADAVSSLMFFWVSIVYCDIVLVNSTLLNSELGLSYLKLGKMDRQ
jgi:hypothetical protein